MIDWIVMLMRTIGAPGVALAIAIETIFPPIPSELILPLAGFTASRGHYSVVSAIFWATVGSLVGAWFTYYLGYKLGIDRLKVVAAKLPLTDVRDVDRATDWFNRHGVIAVLIGRLVPGVRSLVSIPAGVARMNLLVFTGYTLLGSAVFNTALIVIGYQLGARYHLVQQYIDQISTGVAVIAVAVVSVSVIRRLRRRFLRG